MKPPSNVKTPAQYIASLPTDRAQTIATVRAVVNEHIPPGYEECLVWGTIGWTIPPVSISRHLQQAADLLRRAPPSASRPSVGGKLSRHWRVHHRQRPPHAPRRSSPSAGPASIGSDPLSVEPGRCKLKSTRGRLASFPCTLTSIGCRSTSFRCKLAATRIQTTAHRRNLTASGCRLTSLRCELSSTESPLIALRCKLTGNRCQLTSQRGRLALTRQKMTSVACRLLCSAVG